MEQSIKVNGLETKSMDSVLKYGQMVLGMKVIGSTTKLKEKESFGM